MTSAGTGPSVFDFVIKGLNENFVFLGRSAIGGTPSFSPTPAFGGVPQTMFVGDGVSLSAFGGSASTLGDFAFDYDLTVTVAGPSAVVPVPPPP